MAILCLSWIVGLFISFRTTRKTASDFYQWAYDDKTLDHTAYSEELSQTPAEFVTRYSKCNEPFKKHVLVVEPTSLPPGYIPEPNYLLSLGSASNGTSFSVGISVFSTFQTGYLRTQIAPGDDVTGSVVVVIKTSLFGW